MYVEMKDICKQYGSFKASDHVSFGIEKGKLVALLGPSRQWKDNTASYDCRTGNAKFRRHLHRRKTGQ